MNQGSMQRVEELFHAALDLDGEARALFLAKECADAPEIAAEVESLLAAHDEESDGTSGTSKLRNMLPGAGVTAEEAFGDVLGRLRAHRGAFARYELQDEVGRGGMGVVRRAWDKELERHVAMKIVAPRHLREGSSTADAYTLGLFFKEAKITGKLDHPGIVPVHELGLDDAGNVYFTMRLVRGRELGEILTAVHRGEGDWSLPRALGIVLKACEAVAFAHSKGVIHRDLKPSNVMVGRFGEVYVMDWGIAGLVGGDDSNDIRPRAQHASSVLRFEQGSPFVTADGAIIGTPAFMSPEQARGEIQRVDSASDVYALGAILYQLLSGKLPYDMGDAGGPRPRPAEMLARVVAGPPVPVHALNPKAPPELEAICEKAMARSPAERYASVEDLANDLRSWLEGRVVRAYETGAVAELKKWVRRNTALAAAAAAAVVFLVGGLGSTTYVEARPSGRLQAANEELASVNVDLGTERDKARSAGEIARQEAAEARTQRAAADRVVDFLVDLFRSPDPELALGNEVTAKELLARGVAESSSLPDPLVRARLMDAMGRAYFQLGLYAEAEPLHAGALALHREHAGEDDPDTLLSLNDVGLVQQAQAQLAEAERSFDRAHAGLRALYGEKDPVTLAVASNLAELYVDQGRYQEAVDMHERVLAEFERTLGATHADTLSEINNLGLAYQGAGEYEQAEQYLERALALRRETLPAGHPDLQNSINNVAGIYQEQGRHAEAEPLFREAWDGRRSVQGPEHLATLSSMNNVAMSLVYQRRFGEALDLARASLEAHERVAGKDHPRTVTALSNLAMVYNQQKQFEQALPLFEDALERSRRALGADHPDTLRVHANLADVLESLGRYEQLEETYVDLLAQFRKRFGDQHPYTMSVLNNFAHVYINQERPAEAVPLLEEALSGLQQGRGVDHELTLVTQQTLVLVLEDLDRLDEAEPLAQELLERTPLGDRRIETRRQLLERIRTARAAKQ